MKFAIALLFSLSALTTFAVHAEDGSKRLHELHQQHIERG